MLSEKKEKKKDNSSTSTGKKPLSRDVASPFLFNGLIL